MRQLIFAAVAALLISGCATYQEQGAVGGAVAGGTIGYIIGDALGCKGCEAIFTSLGAVSGGVAGARIGQYMDRQDAANTVAAIDRTPTGRTTAWTNPDTNVRYDVTPTKTYVNNRTNDYCREVRIGEAQVGGKRQEVYGTACRKPDGSWELQK